MAFTHNITQALVVANRNITYATEYSADAQASIDIQVPNGDDHEVALAIDESEMKSLFIVVEVDMTLETNSVDATGGDTINLKAGVPFIWNADAYGSNPFTGNDVTAIFISNDSGNAARFQLEVLFDATP